VVSYINLATLISQKAFKHSRSIVIITYALCGFAHFASMSIFVGGISALVPERIKTITEVAFKALIASTLACLMTASVAGTFFTEKSLLLGIM